MMANKSSFTVHLFNITRTRLYLQNTYFHILIKKTISATHKENIIFGNLFPSHQSSITLVLYIKSVARYDYIQGIEIIL